MHEPYDYEPDSEMGHRYGDADGLGAARGCINLMIFTVLIVLTVVVIALMFDRGVLP